MDMKLMFDLATNVATMRKEGEYKTKDYVIGGKKYPLTFPMQQKFLTKQVQAFMHAPVYKKNNISLQAFAGSADLPKLTKDVFTVNSYTQDWDLGWQRAFRGIQLGQGQLEWEVSTVETGISFKLIPEGEKVEFGDVAGESVTVGIQKYGAGLGVTWEMIQGRKLSRFVQIMEDARAALYALWANVHYGLLATAGNVNQVDWQGSASDRTIDRDIATLNYGANALKKANKDKGYGNMASARLLFFVSPDLDARVEQALGATQEQMRLAEGKGNYVRTTIEPIYTYNSNILADRGLLVLPGNKIQNSVYVNEMGFSKQEIESLNELRTYWTAFGATVADTDQVYELKFSA